MTFYPRGSGPSMEIGPSPRSVGMTPENLKPLAS